VANKFLTYNFAYGGATVDSAIVQPFTSTVKSMKEQVEQEYIPIYGSHPASAPWTASNSLFSFWIGINDVDSTFSSGQFDTIRPKIIAAYQALLLEVYNSGARNFLIINVPAVDRSQFTAAMGASAPATEKAAIAAFNSDVASMMTSFKQSHSDITYFLFDSYTLFTNILNNPETYPATAQLKVLDNYCPDYSKYVLTLRYTSFQLTGSTAELRHQIQAVVLLLHSISG
jgi:phospholipase/lecithinase/hemolysin